MALHNSDVRTEKHRTGLTTYLIDKRKKGINIDEIKWSKMFEVNPRQKGEKMCNLCNLEKTSIAIADPTTSLNKRSEILQRCRHRDKLVLANNLSQHRRRTFGSSRPEVLDPVRESEEPGLEVNVVTEDAERIGAREQDHEEELSDVRSARPLRKERVDYRSFY